MPQPMAGGPGEPVRSGQHAAPDVARHQTVHPRDDLAMKLPAWDLLPPAEFVRRRPTGG
jgi:hypothetical protein